MHRLFVTGSWVVGAMLTGYCEGVLLPPPPFVQERGAESIHWADDDRGQLRPALDAGPYDFGDPTDEEQLYLELMNRSRRDPAAEGIRLVQLTEKPILDSYTFHSVDLEAVRLALAAFEPAPPLAFERRLLSAARGHSLWMKATGRQMHNEVDLLTGAVINSPDRRLTAAGYPWQRLGESIFAYAESPEHGHAGFVVDWGPGPSGVQEPPGHRISNFRSDFSEVGIGVVNGAGANGTGPQIVTIDFAARRSPVPLVTGAVFYDLNGNGFYDLGEGIGGVTIRMPGSTAYAVTAGSGGYSVPTADGQRAIGFSWPGGALGSASVEVSGGANAKADLILPYTAPRVTGTPAPSIAHSNAYDVAAIPGATGYRWRTLLPKAPPSLNAESGLDRIRLDAPGSPFPVVPRGNGKAYHLTHGSGQGDQVMELDAWIRPKAGGEVRFSHQLGLAGDAQVAVLQMREEEGEWIELWSKAGDNSEGARTFTVESIRLSNVIGKLVRFRFLYLVRSGVFYYPQLDAKAGFQLDDIVFPGCEEIVAGAVQDIAVGHPLIFSPDAAIPIELVVRASRVQGYWPWGPPLAVTPRVGPPPVPRLSGMTIDPLGGLRLRFTVQGAGAGAPALIRSPTLNGVFVPVPGILETNAPGDYTFRYVPEGHNGYLRISLP